MVLSPERFKVARRKEVIEMVMHHFGGKDGMAPIITGLGVSVKSSGKSSGKSSNKFSEKSSNKSSGRSSGRSSSKK